MVGKWAKVIAAIVIVWILYCTLLTTGINARRHKTVTNSQWEATSLKIHAI